MRQAGILTYGMSLLTERVIDITKYEKSDFDFIAKYIEGDCIKYVPVQLKELVPSHLNKKQSLEDIFKKLKAYSSSNDLVIEIYISRNIKLNVKKIKLKNSNFREIYLFESCSKNNEKWFIYGDIQQNNPVFFKFNYPKISS